MTWSAFGAQIKALRQARGLTQIELAQRAGVSRIYVAKLEGGDRLSPSLPVLERIARALGARLRVELEVPSRQRSTRGERHGR